MLRKQMLRGIEGNNRKYNDQHKGKLLAPSTDVPAIIIHTEWSGGAVIIECIL